MRGFGKMKKKQDECYCDTSRYGGDSFVGKYCEYFSKDRCTSKNKCFCKTNTSPMMYKFRLRDAFSRMHCVMLKELYAKRK